MKNINEIINFCKTYFKDKKTSSGINLYLKKEEIDELLSFFNCDKISECFHIMEYGYVGVCKICFKKTEYLGINKLYRKYCCHKCSTLDKENLSERINKGLETKKINNKKVIIKKDKVNCKYCQKEYLTVKNPQNKFYCEEHKKKCLNCEKRHKKAGKCCSIECTNIVKTKTNLKNSGVKHNLLISGNRPNQIEFYMKKGFSELESNIFLIDFQKQTAQIGNNEENLIKKIFTNNSSVNIEEYLDRISNKIINYKYKELYKPYDLLKSFVNINILNKFGIKYIYDKIIKNNPQTFKYKKINFIRNKYGYLSITLKGELLKSKGEYDFYQLLINNNIDYIIGKRYPNSTYMYDFYLPKFDAYIEIAGMMKDQNYKEKMDLKKEKFNSIIIENYKDMLIYIQKIKNIENENKNN